MSVTEIRPLKDDEFDRLCALMDAYKRDIEEPAMNEDEKGRFREAVIEKKILFIVACEEEELVGMCSICETFSTFRCYKSGVFEDFYIIPQRRRTGLARRMVNTAFGIIRARGVKTLWVGSSPSDVRMYESLGFDVPLGVLRSWNGSE